MSVKAEGWGMTDQQYYSTMRREMADAYDNGLGTPLAVISVFLHNQAVKQAMCTHNWQEVAPLRVMSHCWEDVQCTKCGVYQEVQD